MAWYRVSVPYATFGVKADGGTVVEAAPIGYWMVGRPLHLVFDWAVGKRGTVERVA